MSCLVNQIKYASNVNRYQFQANDDTSATGQSAFPFPREFIMDLPR